MVNRYRKDCNDINWIDNKSDTALMYMIDARHIAAIEFLLNHYYIARVNSKGESPLITGTRMNSADIVKILLDRNCNVNALDKEGKTTLRITTKMASSKILTSLLQQHSNVNTVNRQGNTVLMIATDNGHREIVE